MFDVKPCDPKNTTVLLLEGGTSGEREISLVTSRAVAEGLRSAGFSVEEVDTGKDGYLHQIAETQADVVYIGLHGKCGEDGTVQGLCELIGKPYVGPGVLASALAMDKAQAKIFYRASGLPTPNAVRIRRGDEVSIDRLVERVGEKSVVKPATEGSALGVSIAHDPQELKACLDAALEIDRCALVESFVEGMEITVGVLGNDFPQALPVIEIVPKNEFYDFEAKYAEGGAQHICPARIDDNLRDECQRIAVAAHEALGCRGVSRSDMIIDGDGNPWVLETNTLPGMTPTSLLPDAASVLGIDFPALCRLLVEYALEDGVRKQCGQDKVRP